MNAKETFGAIGGCALLLALMAVGIALTVGFVLGGVWVSTHLLPWLWVVSLVSIAIVIFVLLPLAIPRSTRGFSSNAIFIASYVFGATLWMFGLLLTYFTWGIVAVVIGLCLMGVGVVPMAMAATLFKGLWNPFFTLIVLAVATYGCRIGGLFLAQSLDTRRDEFLELRHFPSEGEEEEEEEEDEEEDEAVHFRPKPLAETPAPASSSVAPRASSNRRVGYILLALSLALVAVWIFVNVFPPSEWGGANPHVTQVAAAAAAQDAAQDANAAATDAQQAASTATSAATDAANAAEADAQRERTVQAAAAEQGNAQAQFNLARMYYFGLGGPQDYAQAAVWANKSAAQGNAFAQSLLGILYANGQGVPQDYAQAVEWYRKGAAQSEPFSMTALGSMYASGQGVLQDFVKAYALYNLSAALNSSNQNVAASNRTELMSRMTPAQVSAGQALTRQMQQVGVLQALDPEVKPAPVTAPTAPDDTAWDIYVQEVIKQNMNAVTDQVDPYFLPAQGGDDYQAKYDRQLHDLQATVQRGVRPGNMLVFASPDSTKMADLVVAAYKDAAPNSMQDIVVLFIGNVADAERVRAAIAPTNATYRFVEAK